jgi:TonB family protein
MPITETPTNPADRPPERPSKRKRHRYEELEPHELFSLIEEYEDERARARLRESIWISIIVYMFVAWFLFYGPAVLFHQPHVINPADALKNRKDLTYLDLPPDALKQVQPKHSDAISDKNRIAETKKPTIDKKTMEQLQAMRKARQAAEPPPPPSQQPTAPELPQAAQAPEPKPAQPLPQNQQSQVEAPHPAPSMNSGALSPGEAIRQAARNARNAAGSDGGFGQGGGDAGKHSGLQGGAEILSDTLGVDFGPYMQRVIRETYRAWDPLIPEAVRPPLYKQGKVYIQFMITPDGSVKNMKLIGPSGDVSLDRAAWGGITGANYPVLPKEFKGPYLELRFAFFYNIKPGG